MIKDCPIRRKLTAGKAVIGIWNTLASPIATEVMAQAGFDFQIIDLEHGPFVLDHVHDHVRACESAGCSPLVRVPANADWMVLQALDQGAHGIVMPQVKSAQEAQQLLQHMKYHPMGRRGFSPFTKAGGFTRQHMDTYVTTSNAMTVSAVIVESEEGLSRLDEILAVPGLDVVYFGAYDLSQALGHPGEVRHPRVVEAIRRGAEQVARAGCYAGGFVPQSKEDIAWLLDMGMRVITYEVDSSILYRHISDVTEWFGHQADRSSGG